MRVPRDVSGEQLVKLLARYGYRVTRQTGGHLRLTTTAREEGHITIPVHNPLKVGTLSSILADVASQIDITKDALIRDLFFSSARQALGTEPVARGCSKIGVPCISVMVFDGEICG